MSRLWGLFLVLGLVSVLLGFAAISSRFIVTTTFAFMIVFGVLLLIAGFAELFHALMVRNWRGFALHLLAAGLYLMLGLFTLEHPGKAAAALTLLLAAAFFVGGLLRLVFALATRAPAWPWVLLHGAVDLILGVLILSDWRESSEWVIGLFVGIDLIFHGWAWVILALNVRNYTPPQSASPAL
jgi:uncharacterized membrane protein HdeD (DUF308 family)